MAKKKILFNIVFFMLVITLIFSTQSFAAVDKVNNLNVTVDGTRAYLNWNQVDGANGYDVYVKVPGRDYGYIGSVNGNGATVIGFEINKTYSVKVRSYKLTSGQKTYSGYSNEVSFTAKNGEELQVANDIGKVTGLKVTSNGQKSYLSWNAVSNVNGYDVYVKLPGNSEYGYIGSVRNNAAIVTGFTVGKTYSIKVRAYKTVNGQKLQGDYSDESTFTAKTEGITLPIEDDKMIGKVSGLEAKVTDTEVKLEWDKVTGASGYEIEVKTDTGTKTYTTTSTSKTVTGITDPDYKYTATVKAYKYVNGKKQYGDSSTVTFRSEFEEIDKVKGLDAEVDGTKVYLQWNKLSNADGYEVKVRTHTGTKTYTTTSTNKTVTGITDPDYDYTALVRAYKYVGGKKQYGHSTKVSFRAEEKAPDKVKDLDVDVRDNRAYLDWKKVSGADGYEICISIPGLHDVDIISTKNTYQTAISDTLSDYKAKVRAYKYINGKKVYGEYSNTVRFRADMKKIDKVTGLKASVSGTTANITWNKVSGADGYELRILIPLLHEVDVDSKTNSFKLTGMTSYSSHRTKVRAYKIVNGKKVYGEYSTAIDIYRK